MISPETGEITFKPQRRDFTELRAELELRWLFLIIKTRPSLGDSMMNLNLASTSFK